jgi:hypothetical protein
MTINVTVLPESGGALPAVRTAQPVISAAGVNDAAALARQQLPNAVPATSLIAAYNANAVAAPKPPQRLTANQPSSALAAQLIGQTPAISEEELAIFTPITPPSTAASNATDGNDFLNDLRIARGDLSSVKKAPVPPATTESSATSAAVLKATLLPTQPTLVETSLRGTLSQFAAGLPTMLTQWMRRPNLVQARGVSAYQLAQARNAGLRSTAIPNPS